MARYMYGETLGRWRTADLLIGLAYLARSEREEHPVADIARCGELIGSGPGQQQQQVLVSTFSLILDFCKVVAYKMGHVLLRTMCLEGLWAKHTSSKEAPISQQARGSEHRNQVALKLACLILRTPGPILAGKCFAKESA